MQRPRLLVSAFSYGPDRGSEPGLGWHSVQALAEEYEVWVLVDVNCLPALPPGSEDVPQVHLLPVRLPLYSRLIGRVLTHSVFWLLYYYLWQVWAAAVALRWHQRVDFHAAVHVTYAKYSVPSLLPLLGIPFVLGPVGGAEAAPLCFYHGHGLRIWLEEALRMLLQQATRLDPLLRWSLHRTALAVGTTPETAAALSQLGAPHVQMRPGIALSETELSQLSSPAQTGQQPLTLLYVGRLLHWKGLHLALHAMAGLPQLQLRIIGSGPARASLQALAQQLGVSTEFLGELPRSEVLRHYTSAHAFIHPSLHDSGATSVVEALAAGLPVLCLNYGGPSVAVTSECGWVLPAEQPTAAISALRAALLELPQSRVSKSTAARERAQQHYSWTQRGAQLRDNVRQVLR
jgi:glycosyltransferase involved in cell wall biosynthesis